MESAALEAYRKDIESNADLSSRAINETLKTQNLELSSKKLWHEVKQNEGPTYYWNTETNETVWEPPSSGYLSLAEQEALSFVKGKHQLHAADKFRNKQDRLKLEDDKHQLEEERAAAEREKMKARRVVEEPEPVITTGPILEIHSGPYGQWKTVQERPKKMVDLQLPKPDEYVVVAIPTEKPEPIRDFKQKTISNLSTFETSSDTGFKKRKFPLSQKRNVRQRFGDD